MVDHGPSEERGVACHRKLQPMDRVIGPRTRWTEDHRRRGVWPVTWKWSQQHGGPWTIGGEGSGLSQEASAHGQGNWAKNTVDRRPSEERGVACHMEMEPTTWWTIGGEWPVTGRFSPWTG